MRNAVAYYRVSKPRQGQSGLGLEAQKQNVQLYAAATDLCLEAEFVEVKSGYRKKRPTLSAALRHCRKKKALLLISNLDRLGRDADFIIRLNRSGVDFVAVDNPHATKLVIHIMAVFAEHERDRMSMRTSEALQAAKRRGAVLGKYGATVLAPKNKFAAQVFAASLQPTIKKFQRQGFSTVRALQIQLNQSKIPTFRGGTRKWHINTVHRLLKQIKNNQTYGATG